MKTIKKIILFFCFLTSITNSFATDVTYSVVPPTSLWGIPQSDGKINLDLSGGKQPFEFEWEDSNGNQLSGGIILANIPAGIYCVTITDANCCTANGCIEVENCSTISSPPSLNIEVFNPTSSISNDGSIDLTVTGTSSPGYYSYEWTTPTGYQFSEDISNAGIGTYCVTVTDLCGNQSTDCVEIDNPCLMTIEDEIIFACPEYSNGSIDLTITNNDPSQSFTMKWSNGETTEDISGLYSGNYCVTITKGNNSTECSTSKCFFVGAQQLTIGEETQEVCNELEGGNITLFISGCSEPYTFQWSNGETSQNLIGIPAGNYTVTVSDESGCCVGIKSVDLTYEYIVYAEEIYGECEEGSNNGSIMVGVNQANPPIGGAPSLVTFEYLWDNGSTGNHINGLTPGEYCVELNVISLITNNVICTSEECFTLGGSEIPINLISIIESCPNQPTGSIHIEGNPFDYYYNWSNGQSGGLLYNIEPLLPGNYTVTVTNNIGCTASEVFTIEPNAEELSVNSTIFCQTCIGASEGCISVDIAGGKEPLSYQWSNGVSGLYANAINGLAQGEYTVTVTDACGEELIETFEVPLFPHEEIFNLASCLVEIWCNSDPFTSTLVSTYNLDYTYVEPPFINTQQCTFYEVCDHPIAKAPSNVLTYGVEVQGTIKITDVVGEGLQCKTKRVCTIQDPNTFFEISYDLEPLYTPSTYQPNVTVLVSETGNKCAHRYVCYGPEGNEIIIYESEHFDCPRAIVDTNVTSFLIIDNDFSNQFSSEKTKVFFNEGIENVYPNPFNNNINIIFFSTIKQKIAIYLRNTLGQVVRTITTDVLIGRNNVIIEQTSNLPNGIYYLEVLDATNKKHLKKLAH